MSHAYHGGTTSRRITMAWHQPWRRLVFFTSILPRWWLFLASPLSLLPPVRVEVAHALALSPNLMDPIINHPAVSELGLDRDPRRKLKVKHMKFFPRQHQQRQADNGVGIEDFQRFSHDHGHVKSRMNELGLMACRTGVVPRKEFLETFAAAVYINEKFPHITRFADVAAGHGLLSWFLLVLSDDINAGRSPLTMKKKEQKKKKSTAICIDRRMPGSAEKIADVMLEMYPHLKSRWCYVEADLAAIETHPTTLLVSVHACGSLSDRIIEMAIDGNAPLALVPCCHTIKAKKGYQPHPLIKMDVSDVESVARTLMKENNGVTLGDVVDQVRHDTLLKAGYDVEECMLPEKFTKQNRLILGEKQKEMSMMLTSPENAKLKHDTTATIRPPPSPGKQLPKIKLPLADDSQSRAICESASGRKQSSARLVAAVPRHFNPTYDVSVWLPDNQPLSEARFIALQVLGNDCCESIQKVFSTPPFLHEDEEKVYCTISALNERHTDKMTGNTSQTYRFKYSTKLSLGEVAGQPPKPISKKLSKAIHAEICQRLPTDLGLFVR
mmetsp:Transcript_25555/g.60437  ORF Transcript_25555/g.60437 Transcript_25555/m.60437 type:complete len:554 (-) Transcript_25555:1142-2803(-)